MKRTHTRLGKKQKRYRYMHHRSDDRNIILKETSLYKPLLITFLIFLVAMITIFPTSIFEVLYPEVMTFFRLLVRMFISSAIATLLVLPVSVLDIQLLAYFGNPVNTNLMVLVVILFAVFSDTVFAYIGYKFTKTLRAVFVKKAKKADIDKSNEKLQKYFSARILSSCLNSSGGCFC